jgi:MoaA/NifB/PqqE/SkfB family radical SAM enzyme
LWTEEAGIFYDRMMKEAVNGAPRRQFMIFLSYECNLACPYCFAGAKDEPTLSLARVLEILDWAVKNGAQEVTFCGGEPTIYPHFPEVLDGVAERALKTYFATNLLGPERVISRLRPETVHSLIVHVAPRPTYRGKQWTTLLANMKRVRDQGVRQGLRVNMFKKDCDFSHVFAVAREVGHKEVQFALTFPSARGDNEFIPLDRFQEMIPAVIELQQACAGEGLRFLFSKPLPLCLFPEDQREEMVQHPEYSPSCSVFEDNCSHNACISPRENVSPCLGLLDVIRPWSSFGDWEEMSAFCRAEVLPLLDRPLFDYCPECFLFERRLCQGACLSHKSRDLTAGTCHA